MAGEPGGGEAATRALIEDAFGANVREAMGIADVSPSLWGECEEQAGMHFCGRDFIYAELIDPAGTAPIPWEDGAEGELVYTSLRRDAMPVVRFRSRDRVVVTARPCSCGRTSARVRCVGRTDDLLIVRGTNLFPSAVREVVAEFRPRVGGMIQIRPAHTGVRQDVPPRVLVELGEGERADAELAGAIQVAMRGQLAARPRSSSSPTGRCRAASTRATSSTSRSPLRADSRPDPAVAGPGRSLSSLEQRAHEVAGLEARHRRVTRRALHARRGHAAHARGLGGPALEPQDLDPAVHVEQVDEVAAPGDVP